VNVHEDNYTVNLCYCSSSKPRFSKQLCCSSSSIQRPRLRRPQRSQTLQLLCKESSWRRHLWILFTQVWREISGKSLEKTIATRTDTIYRGINFLWDSAHLFFISIRLQLRVNLLNLCYDLIFFSIKCDLEMF
jgi:hypothetical protein